MIEEKYQRAIAEAKILSVDEEHEVYENIANANEADRLAAVERVRGELRNLKGQHRNARKQRAKLNLALIALRMMAAAALVFCLASWADAGTYSSAAELARLRAENRLLDCHARNYRERFFHASGPVECKGLDAKLMKEDRRVPLADECEPATDRVFEGLRKKCGLL